MVFLSQVSRQYATLITSAYAPTMTNPEEVYNWPKSNCCCHAQNKLSLLGNFSATIDIDHTSLEGVLGNNEIGKCNNNGLLLQETCDEHELIINKTTWMHPWSKHWHCQANVANNWRGPYRTKPVLILCVP